MTPLDSLGSKLGGRCKQHTIIFNGDRVNNIFKSRLAVMQNFATFEWFLWQQGC